MQSTISTGLDIQQRTCVMFDLFLCRRPLITETLIPRQSDEDEDIKDDNKSFAELAGNWVHNVFQRGNKTEIEMVRLKPGIFHLLASWRVCLLALTSFNTRNASVHANVCHVAKSVKQSSPGEPSRELLWLQIVKKHDVDSAVKILFKNAGSQFQDHTVKWGAVHADERRSAPFAIFLLTPSWAYLL